MSGWIIKSVERDGELVSVPIYEDDNETGYDTREEYDRDKEIKKNAK